jgi:hypothetical protein
VGVPQQDNAQGTAGLWTREEVGGMEESSNNPEFNGRISKRRKHIRATRSNVKHSISHVLNSHRIAVPTPLFVRTDSVFVDVQDVLKLIWSPSMSIMKLTKWKQSCHSAHHLKEMILEKGGPFAQRVTPYDIVRRKWISPMASSVSTSQGRLCASAVGMCVILSILRTSRRIQALESTYSYFENVANGHHSIDLLYEEYSAKQFEIPMHMRSLLDLPDKPFTNWDLSHDSVCSDRRVHQSDDVCSSSCTSLSDASTFLV